MMDANNLSALNESSEDADGVLRLPDKIIDDGPSVEQETSP
jgi:hypothetical protein